MEMQHTCKKTHIYIHKSIFNPQLAKRRPRKFYQQLTANAMPRTRPSPTAWKKGRRTSRKGFAGHWLLLLSVAGSKRYDTFVLHKKKKLKHVPGNLTYQNCANSLSPIYANHRQQSVDHTLRKYSSYHGPGQRTNDEQKSFRKKKNPFQKNKTENTYQKSLSAHCVRNNLAIHSAGALVKYPNRTMHGNTGRHV